MMANLDTTVEMMLTPHDDEVIGLTGRDVQLQGTRLCSAYNRLKKAITEDDAWADGFCIVCNNHVDRHDDDCLLKGVE
jgi:hypothetical protein